MSTHLLFAAALLALGCGGASPASTTPPTPAPTASAAIVGTLRELQNGDRACYVILDTTEGQRSIEGDFELCPGAGSDASALIGQEVELTTERAKVQAASCQGDPECSASDEVDLVVAVRARAGAAPTPTAGLPKEASLSHGGTAWGVYLAIAPAGDPALAAATAKAKALGYEAFAKDLACDLPTAAKPPVSADGQMLIAVYLPTEADARAVAAAAGAPAPWVGQVKTMCMD